MSNALNTMYSRLPEKVSVGVGINSGYVNIEDIGANDSMLGSPVNTAFRFTSLTKELKTNVVISYRLVRDVKRRQYVGAKGMEHEVAVCCYKFHELLELIKTLKDSGK